MPNPEKRTPAPTRTIRSRSARIVAAAVAIAALCASGLIAVGATPAAAATCTKTSSGSCIQGGEFCPSSKEGQIGRDANGTAYECKDGHYESVTVTTAAQAVGRFLDGSAGGMAIQKLVDLKDARAKAAPDSSSRNPLDAELFGQAGIPIGNGAHLPGGGVFKLGAANQIAVARTSGYSYGAAGAISNTGGAELTDESGDFPADATINLSGAALNSVKIPGLPASVPGLPTGTPVKAAALGGVVAKIGAAQALAQTEVGGKIVTPQSSLAGLDIAIGSPALAALLKQLKSASGLQLGSIPGLAGLLDGTPVGGVTSGTPVGGVTSGTPVSGGTDALTLPSACSLTTSATPDDISLDGGAVIISAKDAQITIDVGKLLKRALGEDISNLSTSNFDLVKFLIRELPTILSNGLEQVVTGITDPLKAQFKACTTAVASKIPGGTTVTDPIIAAIDNGEQALLDGIDQITKPLISASGGGLATLADGLKGLIDIGLNVQSGPNIQPHDTNFTYSTKLAKTPDQATSVVKGQSLVRAIEIDLLDAAGSGSGVPGGLPSLPSTSAVGARQLAGARQADGTTSASGSSAVSLAIANAAAGPSTASAAAANANIDAASTSLPTGVPAGAAGRSDNGSPLLPVSLLALLALLAVGGGTLALRTRAGSVR